MSHLKLRIEIILSSGLQGLSAWGWCGFHGEPGQGCCWRSWLACMLHAPLDGTHPGVKVPRIRSSSTLCHLIHIRLTPKPWTRDTSPEESKCTSQLLKALETSINTLPVYTDTPVPKPNSLPGIGFARVASARHRASQAQLVLLCSLNTYLQWNLNCIGSHGLHSKHVPLYGRPIGLNIDLSTLAFFVPTLIRTYLNVSINCLSA